jgi:multiple sugar transport system permease protein
MATITQTAAQQRSSWDKMRRQFGQISLYVLLGLGCLLTLLPFVWMFFGSFKTSAEIVRVPPTFWPQNPTLENYQEILTDPRVPLFRFYLNSLIVAVGVVILTLFTSSLAGYIFAKYQFYGKSVLFVLVLSTIMVPFPVLMIPTYLILVQLGLIDTLWSLIIPAGVNAFGIFLMKQFIESLPNELIDAARIDGASEWGIYWRIILPQVGPALATLSILTFMFNWNNYLWPLIVITTNERRTLPIMLTWYNGLNYQRYDTVMAASVLVVVPVLIVYVFFQRWIVEGFSLSGLK